MLNDLYAALPQLAPDVLFISLAGWLGIWFFVRSAGIANGVPALGGAYTFLIVWAVAILANFYTQGRASSAIHALYFSLLAIGCLVWLIAAVARAFSDSSRRDRRPRRKWGSA